MPESATGAAGRGFALGAACWIGPGGCVFWGNSDKPVDPLADEAFVEGSATGAAAWVLALGVNGKVGPGDCVCGRASDSLAESDVEGTVSGAVDTFGSER